MERFKIMIKSSFKCMGPVLTCGIVAVLLLSCGLLGATTYLELGDDCLSVGASVFQNGHVHKLLLYPFHHQTAQQLLLSASALVLLSGSLERGIGTVRFLFVFLLLSILTGLVYAFVDLLQGSGSRGQAEGLVPITLASVAVTTTHTRMARGFLCGVSFPTVALPWVLLLVLTLLVPHSVLPCNVVAILIGWTYGKGWFSVIDVSEARAAFLEKVSVFRLLRRLGGDLFVPTSAEERRKTLLPRINPTPGSYPVQAYAPVSSTGPPQISANVYEGWPTVSSASPRNPDGYGPPGGHALRTDQALGDIAEQNSSADAKFV